MNSTSPEKAFTGSAVTVGGPTGSYKAAAGSIVLSRPVGFTQAATALTDLANLPKSGFVSTDFAAAK